VLHKGDKVTLLDPTPEHGYYQVGTQDGKQGWVSLKAVKVLASPSSSDPAVDPEGLTTDNNAKCDDALWNHVYHSHRLIVKQQCVTVTGTIVDATNGKEPDGVRHESDGDTHGWLKVDPQFENLLNPGNIHDEGGNLVFRNLYEDDRLIFGSISVGSALGSGKHPHTSILLEASET
jgi:hypothetical protein